MHGNLTDNLIYTVVKHNNHMRHGGRFSFLIFIIDGTFSFLFSPILPRISTPRIARPFSFAGTRIAGVENIFSTSLFIYSASMLRKYKCRRLPKKSWHDISHSVKSKLDVQIEEAKRTTYTLFTLLINVRLVVTCLLYTTMLCCIDQLQFYAAPWRSS